MNYDNDSIIEQIGRFLERIGIELIEEELTKDTFLPGVNIDHGKLVIDRKKLLYPGDMLHEAGHIAVAHPVRRAQMADDLTDGLEKAPAGEELAAILWSYAAAQEIGLPLEVVLHDHGYKGDAAWLREQLQNGTYIGLPLLVWMGMTEHEGETGFPRMKKWLREDRLSLPKDSSS